MFLYTRSQVSKKSRYFFFWPVELRTPQDISVQHHNVSQPAQQPAAHCRLAHATCSCDNQKGQLEKGVLVPAFRANGARPLGVYPLVGTVCTTRVAYTHHSLRPNHTVRRKDSDRSLGTLLIVSATASGST